MISGLKEYLRIVREDPYPPIYVAIWLGKKWIKILEYIAPVRCDQRGSVEVALQYTGRSPCQGAMCCRACESKHYHWNGNDDISVSVSIMQELVTRSLVALWCITLYYVFSVFRKCRGHKPLAHCSRQCLIHAVKFTTNLEEMAHYEFEIFINHVVFNNNGS